MSDALRELERRLDELHQAPLFSKAIVAERALCAALALIRELEARIVKLERGTDG